MEEIMRIASEIQTNNKDEAGAIEGYTKLLSCIMASELDEDLRQEAFDIISEIIADELNHQEKLKNLYIKFTGITPNKE